MDRAGEHEDEPTNKQMSVYKIGQDMHHIKLLKLEEWIYNVYFIEHVLLINVNVGRKEPFISVSRAVDEPYPQGLNG
jgi:hypothetical protein